MKRAVSLFLFTLSFFCPVFAHEIRSVPFVKQKSKFCGPAALSSVMSFYGINTSQDEIAAAVYSEKLNGALITDLENFALKKNFKTTLASGSLNDIKSFIDKGNPVIILLDQGFWIFSSPHYIVVFGYDYSGFKAHNGYRESIFIDYDKLESKWKKMGNVYLVIFR